MSEALLPLFGAAAGLMLVAGAAKLRAPADAREGLRAFGLPASNGAARALGAAEASLGAVCLLAPGEASAAALAVAYLLLAASVADRRRRGALAPCGCFGAASGSLNRGHVVLDMLGAAIATAATLAPPPGIATVLAAGPAGLALLAGIAAAVYLAVALLTLLPSAWGSYASEESR